MTSKTHKGFGWVVGKEMSVEGEGDHTGRDEI